MKTPLENRPVSSRPHVQPVISYYHWLVIAAGGLLLLWATARAPYTFLPGVATITLLFVALQTIFPLYLAHSELTLIHIISLGTGILYGPAATGWGAMLGILIGFAVRGRWLDYSKLPASKGLPAWLQAGMSSAGVHLTALLLALMATGVTQGLAPTSAKLNISQLGVQSLPPLMLYAFLHGILFSFHLVLTNNGPASSLRRSFVDLFLVETLPLPFILIAVLAYPAIQITALVVLGAFPTIVSILFNAMSIARLSMERRLQELSELNRFSQTLRAAVDLQELLAVIQEYINKLMGVNDLYIANFEPVEEYIHYLLVVENNQRTQWASRPQGAFLTDQVIREQQPIIYNMQPGDPYPTLDISSTKCEIRSWIGVPLVSSTRTVSCLALYSCLPQARFTRPDLDLLTIIAGQVSAAIDNVSLIEQAHKRADQLETINQISALITASLDPQEVLAQVCQSVSQVTGGKHSAIFLITPEESLIWLAYAHQLPNAFVEQNRSFSIADNGRTRCLRTGYPFLNPDLENTTLDTDLVTALQGIGIQSFGDFPLTAPEGPIGYLSVYFETPHEFSAEEVELLQTLASHAALAVSNARLHARTDLALSQRARQLAILEAVGRELAAAIHSERLFDMILNYARELTDSPWGGIGVYDPAAQTIQVKAIRGYTQTASRYPLTNGISGRALRIRQAILINDVSQDADYLDLTNGAARSQLTIPLIHEERVLGLITLESPHLNGYTESDQAFISQLANQAAIAIVNAELYTDVSKGRDRLAAVLNSVQEGILMLESGLEDRPESKGLITLVNESFHAITGLPVEALIGKNLANLPPESLRLFGFTQADAQALVQALAQNQIVIPPIVTEKVTALKPERYLERSSLPVFGSQSSASGWLVIIRDVTHEYELSQARELITETLVHDLRSPLAAVLGSLDVIDENIQLQKDSDPIVSQALALARRGSRRVLGLVESLLDISRMQSGSMDLVYSPINLHSLAAIILSDFVTTAGDYGVLLRNEVPSDLPLVNADQGKISRVLMNLVDNALKFTPTGEQVILTAELAEKTIVVKVLDRGPGVPEGFRQKIFERFTQVPEQHGRRRGTGLGLTFCRLAVEAHGGRIWVEPRPGGGSIFAFTLPRQAAQE